MTRLLDSLSWLIGRFSLRTTQQVGAGLGRLVYLCSSRKHEVRARIMECLEVGEAEARGIHKRMYANLGMTACEFLRIPRMQDAEVRELIEYHHKDRLPPDGHRFITLVAHTGNWELMAAATPFEIPSRLNVVVKALKPASLNDWVWRVRARWGIRMHDRRGSSRDLLRVLKSGEPVAFILDQNAKRNWGVFVDFFGKPACTSDGLAQLAAISGYAIFPVFCRRDPETRKLIVEVEEEVPGPVDRSPEEILRVTADCTRRIEQFVRTYPDQWIWMHRRWRTQPEA